MSSYLNPALHLLDRFIAHADVDRRNALSDDRDPDDAQPSSVTAATAAQLASMVRDTNRPLAVQLPHLLWAAARDGRLRPDTSPDARADWLHGVGFGQYREPDPTAHYAAAADPTMGTLVWALVESGCRYPVTLRGEWLARYAAAEQVAMAPRLHPYDRDRADIASAAWMALLRSTAPEEWGDLWLADLPLLASHLAPYAGQPRRLRQLTHAVVAMVGWGELDVDEPRLTAHLLVEDALALRGTADAHMVDTEGRIGTAALWHLAGNTPSPHDEHSAVVSQAWDAAKSRDRAR